MDTTRRLLRTLVAWPVQSQQTARRNALVASTALAERRRQREDVEEFLARRTGPFPSMHAAPRAAREPGVARRGVI